MSSIGDIGDIRLARYFDLLASKEERYQRSKAQLVGAVNKDGEA